MAKPYVVTITNGSGASEAVTGEYTVTATVAGYDGSTIDSANLTITEDSSSYSFKVAATSTLFLHLSEEKIEGSTPVEEQLFIDAIRKVPLMEKQLYRMMKEMLLSNMYLFLQKEMLQLFIINKMLLMMLMTLN